MSIEDAIKTHLRSLNTAAGQRVFADEAPQETETPYVVFWLTSVDPDHTHEGAVTAVKRTFQISTFAPKAGDAIAVARAIRRAIDGYSGAMSSLAINAVFYVTEQRFREDLSKLHHVAQDFEFQYEDNDAS